MMAETGKYLRPGRGAVRRSKTRRKRGFLLIAALVTIVIGAAAALTYFSFQVMTAPGQFTPRQLVIKGAIFADAAVIRERVNESIGQNMLVADLDRVTEKVNSLPWIEKVSARKIIPDTLELTVIEQRPVAFAIEEGVVLLVDEQGSVIAPLTPELPFTDLPLITGLEELDGELRQNQLARGAGIIVALSRLAVWNERLLEVDVSAPGNETVLLKNALAPVVTGPDNVENGLARYYLIEASLRERYDAVKYIDVRFEDQVVVNGSGN